MVWVTSNRLVIEERRVGCSSPVNKESSPKKEMNLTIVSHNRGTKECHKQIEKSAKGIVFKIMRKEEIDIEVAEIKTKLRHLMKLIQKGIREELKQGFYVRN